MMGKEPGFMFKLFNKVVHNKVKYQLGFDQVKMFFSGAAPFPIRTREFFFDMNMFINNTYGMTETSGPTTSTLSKHFHLYDMKSAGNPLDGTEADFIRAKPGDERGELFFRGRNIFMGYLKNEEATRNALDNSRRIHSGDEGYVDKNGTMFITGRIKEIIVTAGGENVAPIMIEDNIRNNLPFLSQALLIGDQKKYISALLTFRVTTPANELPGSELAPEAIDHLAEAGIKGIKTVQEAMNSPEVKKVIQAGKLS